MSANNKRLASVDALRGLAVAAMLLVNNPGDWSYVLSPLEHSAWNGCTPTDLVFPLFLFIVGVSLALALGPRQDAGASTATLVPVVLKRGLRIIGLGLVLHLLAWWLMGKPDFRLLGVLQRIGLCFMATGALALSLRPRQQWLLLAALLAGYGLLLMGTGLDKIGSLEQRVDTWVLGRWAYEWDAVRGIGFDPEGIVSTLGSLATCLLGWRCGAWLRAGRVQALQKLGAALMLLGWAGDHWGLPFNKQLWTPTFVLWNAGIDALLLVLAHALIDQRGWPALGRAFGVNAIAAYAGAWMCTVFLEGFGWMGPVYARGFGWLEPWGGPYGRSLAFALVFVAAWWAIVRVLDKQRIYIKV